jgi:fatty-acyl-CoA synthase
MSFVDRIIWQGLQKPDAPALSVAGRAKDIVTYADLSRCIGNLTRRLSALGVVPGALYGLYIPDEMLYIAMMLALHHLGAATTILSNPKHVEDWPIQGVFVAGPAEGWLFPAESVDSDWLEGDRVFPLEKPHRSAPDDLCHVIWTSGSTGAPKGVPLTHRLLDLRAEQFGCRLGREFGRAQRVFSSMGPNAAWNYVLIGHLLARGGFVCLPGHSIEQTVGKFAAYKLQAMVAPPAYLSELLRLSKKWGRQFPSLNVVISGGGPLPKRLAEEVRANICNRLVSYFGSAECGGIAAAPVERLDLEQGEVGFIIPGVFVEVVDPASRRPMSEGAGTLRIRSDRAARGYFGPRADAEGRFENEWVYSGDRGAVSAGGLLSLHGRNSSVVNLGGPKSTLEQIEMLYAEAPGVAEAASLVEANSVGVDKLIAVVVPSDSWSAADFWDYCRAKVSQEFWPKRIVVVQSLPYVATGKIDRQKLLTLL